MAEIKNLADFISKIPETMKNYEHYIGLTRKGVSYMSEEKRAKARKKRKKHK